MFRPLLTLRPADVWLLLRLTVSEWVNDRAPRLGASLAFYTALSIAPLLVIMLAIAGFVYGQKIVQSQLLWQVRDLIGPEGANAVQGLLVASHHRVSGTVATVLGVATLMFGASSVMAELTDALNTIWHVEYPNEGGLKNIWRIVTHRVRSFLMVIGVGLLLLLSLLSGAVLAAAIAFFRDLLPVSAWLLESINFIVTLVVTTFVFALVYKVVPRVRLQWSDVSVGACATALLFTVGKILIALYLGRAAIASSYGAAGSFFVTLLWVYYSAQIFFFGAEFTKVYTERFGSQYRAREHSHSQSASHAEPELSGIERR